MWAPWVDINHGGGGGDVKLPIDEFKENHCVFVANWLKTKGLHKLCSISEGV